MEYTKLHICFVHKATHMNTTLNSPFHANGITQAGTDTLCGRIIPHIMWYNFIYAENVIQFHFILGTDGYENKVMLHPNVQEDDDDDNDDDDHDHHTWSPNKPGSGQAGK